MKDRRVSKSDKPFGLAVIALLIFFASVIGLYWLYELEPQLKNQALTIAENYDKSMLPPIITALNKKGENFDSDLVGRKLDQLLLLTTEKISPIPSILAIELELDPDVVGAFVAELDFNRVVTDTMPDSFEIRVNMYTPVTRELFGFATFYHSDEYINQFIYDTRAKLFFFSLIIIVLIICIAWWRFRKIKKEKEKQSQQHSIQIKKIKEQEEKLRQQFIHLAHAERLTFFGEMATRVAHELNQPLAIIQLAAGGLLDHLSKEPHRDDDEADSAQDILDQVKRAADLVQNMRTYSRTDGGAVELINLALPVNNSLSFFKTQFREDKIELEIFIADEIPKVRGDMQKIEQIVVNLLTNARYAVKEKECHKRSDYHKKITVRLFHDEVNNLIVFEVEDNGIGMTPEQLDRCMEPFYTTKNVNEGTGLGLSIVYGIVQELDMDFSSSSHKGQGTVFRVATKVV